MKKIGGHESFSKGGKFISRVRRKCLTNCSKASFPPLNSRFRSPHLPRRSIIVLMDPQSDTRKDFDLVTTSNKPLKEIVI